MTLNAATDKFITRFQAVERMAAEAGRRVQDCSADELNAYWDAHKGAWDAHKGTWDAHKGAWDAHKVATT